VLSQVGMSHHMSVCGVYLSLAPGTSGWWSDLPQSVYLQVERADEPEAFPEEQLRHEPIALYSGTECDQS